MIWFMPITDRPSEAKSVVGARLRVVRAALGFSQKDMAGALNVSPQAWSGWEKGRDLADPLVLARAAVRYGFTLDWIYIGSLAHMPSELAAEIAMRRPDLQLGARPGVAVASDWDKPKAARRQAA
jgi:transcriptional regulator with XRE-family HTH domain